MFGQVPKPAECVGTTNEVYFLIHTFVSHSNPPEVSSKEFCMCERVVVEKNLQIPEHVRKGLEFLSFPVSLKTSFTYVL